MAGRWALVVAWMAVVFGVSSISNLGRAARVPDWISHPIEYGNTFTAVAGLLNILVILDAYDTALGRKR